MSNATKTATKIRPVSALYGDIRRSLSTARQNAVSNGDTNVVEAIDNLSRSIVGNFATHTPRTDVSLMLSAIGVPELQTA